MPDASALQREVLLTTDQAGNLLELSPARIRQLIGAGFIEKRGRDQVPLVSAVRGYIRFLKDEERKSSKTASASRVHDARARDIELKIAERENRLVDIEDAIGAMDDVVGAVKATMSGVPAQFTGDLSQRAKLETLLGQALNAAADMVSAQAADLRSGGAPSIIAGDDA